MTSNVKISPMISPSSQALELVLFKSRERIETQGITSYEGIITFGELADHFQIEANSDQLHEQFKKQRDVDTARINGLKRYWNESQANVFPNMTFFVNKLTAKKEMTVGNRSMVTANISAKADRFICDGQGRTTFIKWLLENHKDNPELREYTISFKLLVTNTKNLSEPQAVQTIKQVFNDYHVSLKKPNASISKSFDSNYAFSRLLNALLDIEFDGQPMRNRIALHGKINQGQVWTFAQYSSMIQKLLNVTPSSAEKTLKDEHCYQVTLNACTEFMQNLFAMLPLNELDNDSDRNHDNMIFTKAIFADAMGFVGRSILDEMLVDDSKSFKDLQPLKLPITEKENKAWIKHRICMDDDGNIKILKGTNKRLAALICQQLRIYPCPALTL